MPDLNLHVAPARRILLTLFFCGTMHAGLVHGQDANLDPRATGLLEKAAAYLGNQQRFSVDTRNTVEDLLASGQRVDIEIATSIVANRPDKLRATRHDHRQQEFYYDGKQLTLYDKPENAYATLPAPDTLEAAFDFTRDTLGFMVPAADLMYKGSFPLLMESLTSAAVIGKAMVDGVSCDHLAFRKPGVDFQVWIADNGEPLFHKYVVTDTSGPERLSVTTVLTNWNFGSAVAKTGFSFNGRPEAIAIEFLRLDSGSVN